MKIIRLLQQVCQVKQGAIYNSSQYFSKGGSNIICTETTLIIPVPHELCIHSYGSQQNNEAVLQFKPANHFFFPQQKSKPTL